MPCFGAVRVKGKTCVNIPGETFLPLQLRLSGRLDILVSFRGLAVLHSVQDKKRKMNCDERKNNATWKEKDD